MDDEYKSFLAELGGGPQDQGGPSGMRHMGGGGGGGGGGRQSRPGDDLPDNCKLYVGNLSPAVTDAVLKSLMEPFGNVLHAVVLLDMTSGMSETSERRLLLLLSHCTLSRPTQDAAKQITEAHCHTVQQCVARLQVSIRWPSHVCLSKSLLSGSERICSH